MQLIGPKGLLTTHAMFEGGSFTIMAPLRLKSAFPTEKEIAEIRQHGIIASFQRIAHEVASYDMYERFIEQGWNQKLTRDIRRELAPRMVRMVTLAWLAAAYEADVVPGAKKP